MGGVGRPAELEVKKMKRLGGSGAFLGLVLFGQLLIHVSGGSADLQCAYVGQSKGRQPRSEGRPFSIGGKRFKPRDVFVLGKSYAGTGGEDQFQHKFRDKHPDTKEPRRWIDFQRCPRGLELKLMYFTVVRPVDQNFYAEDFCPTDILIRTYLVRQQVGPNWRVLRGWLHFEVEIMGRDEMEFIYLQVIDEKNNAVGEFVSNPEEQCDPSKKGLISPSQYQFLPCSAIGSDEPKVAQALFMVKRSQLDDQGAGPQTEAYLSKEELKQGIHVTWKLNEYWCNQHSRINVVAEVWPKSSEQNFAKANRGRRQTDEDDNFCPDDAGRGCLIRRKIPNYWLHLKWYGAADIKLDGELDCTLQAIDYDYGQLDSKSYAWIRGISEVKVAEDPIYRDEYHETKPGSTTHLHRESCQVDNQKAKASDIVTFGGRCKEPQKKYVDHSNLHKCNPVDKTSGFGNYNVYVLNVTAARLNACNQVCAVPDIKNLTHLEEIKKMPGGKSENRTKEMANTGENLKQFNALKVARALEMRGIIFFTRKFHGIVCVFLTMFLIPISHFMARYYKETFMKGKRVGVWFGLHLFVCAAVPSLLFATILPLHNTMDSFGRSQSHQANFHYYFGYGFLWSFLLMVILGGIRPVNPKARLVCMALHSVSGFALYLLAFTLVVQSNYIPGSPSLDECEPEAQLPVGFSYSSQVALVWLLLDLILHAFLTCIQLKVDKNNHIHRQGFGLPFVPCIAPTYERDLVGYRFRRVVLIVYVTVSSLMTLITIVDVAEKDDSQNCTLGQMSCNMSQHLPNQSSSPFGCSSTAIKFYAEYVRRHGFEMSEDGPISI